MLNRGYAYTTIISSKDHGQTLLSHLASLYPHSTPQAWQQKLNNREVTVNGVTATRNNAPREELVYEYNLYDSDLSDVADCYCGAKQCRGTMYSDLELKRRERAFTRQKASNSR